MRKQTLLAAIVAVVAAAGAPSALAGNSVLLPDGSVWQADAAGTYHQVPDVATANALGVDWNSLDVEDALPGPAGDPLPAVQTRTTLGLVATSAAAAPVTPANGDDVLLPDGTVWQGDADGVYHLIPNVATANAMHLDWNSLQLADSLPGPAGDPFPSAA